MRQEQLVSSLNNRKIQNIYVDLERIGMHAKFTANSIKKSQAIQKIL